MAPAKPGLAREAGATNTSQVPKQQQLERQEKRRQQQWTDRSRNTHTYPQTYHVALVNSRSGTAGQPGTSPVLLHRRALPEVLLRGAAKGHACRWYAAMNHLAVPKPLTDGNTGHFTATQWNEQAKAYMPNPDMVRRTLAQHHPTTTPTII